ncbi:MAG TPA: metal-dependent transcriptional regulator [Pyrinomonadaceae bacterium]|nr:metal-dependent transcriptional regulator [Pyrinomonadaceae bacterium]
MKKLTVSKEDYLKAIWTLSERFDETGTEAGTNNLAEMLEVSPPAVSKMLKQMERQSLVAHVPYYGVRLTDDGRKIALKIVRRHRLLERFLVEILGYGLDEVHDEAEQLEHHISDEFTERINVLMKFPKTCPHGSPIPSAEGDF